MASTAIKRAVVMPTPRVTSLRAVVCVVRAGLAPSAITRARQVTMATIVLTHVGVNMVQLVTTSLGNVAVWLATPEHSVHRVSIIHLQRLNNFPIYIKQFANSITQSGVDIASTQASIEDLSPSAGTVPFAVTATRVWPCEKKCTDLPIYLHELTFHWGSLNFTTRPTEATFSP